MFEHLFKRNTASPPHAYAEDLMASLLIMEWIAGYPNQLSGDSIPRDASIVGICDAFDAMTSTRPYRKGMPIQKALGIIEENLGKQFDRAMGLSFLQLGHAGMLNHIAGHTDEGIPLHECPMCGAYAGIAQKSGGRIAGLLPQLYWRIHCRKHGIGLDTARYRQKR